MVIGCMPDPQQLLVNVDWDGNGWQARATGAGWGWLLTAARG
jgi:hypothetical protein